MKEQKIFTKDSSSYSPLWLPPGSIRAIITLITLVVFFYLSIQAQEVTDTLGTIVVTVVAFYFGSRSNAKTEVYNEQAERIENMQLKDQSSVHRQ